MGNLPSVVKHFLVEECRANKRYRSSVDGSTEVRTDKRFGEAGCAGWELCVQRAAAAEKREKPEKGFCFLSNSQFPFQIRRH